jgi:hypothetical protein
LPRKKNVMRRTLTAARAITTIPIRRRIARAGDTGRDWKEGPCPRISQAAMIAAAAFGLRRSGIRERQRREVPLGPHQ